MPIFEDGEESGDFVHIEDVARAILAGLAPCGAASDTINFGSGAATPIMHMPSLLVKATGNVLPHVTAQYRVGDIRHNWADITRFSALCGGPSINLEKGLVPFFVWIQLQPVPPDLLEKENAELKARQLMG